MRPSSEARSGGIPMRLVLRYCMTEAGFWHSCRNEYVDAVVRCAVERLPHQQRVY
jgi:hypothetical protein